MKPFALVLPLFFAVSAAAHAQSLQEAMRSALDTHPEISAGVHARMAAEEQLRSAKGGYLPRVDLVAGYGREGTDSVSTRQGDEHGYRTLSRGEASLTAQQMLFDGFATSSEVKRQRATVNARAYELLSSAATSESSIRSACAAARASGGWPTSTRPMPVWPRRATT